MSTTNNPDASGSQGLLLAYALLGFFLLFAGWQYHEFRMLREQRLAHLQERAGDVSVALLGLVNTQQRGAFLARERLEVSLQLLLRSSDLLAGVALYNANGQVLAMAAEPGLGEEWLQPGDDGPKLPRGFAYWQSSYPELAAISQAPGDPVLVLDRAGVLELFERLREDSAPDSGPIAAERLRERLASLLAESSGPEAVRERVLQRTAFVLDASTVEGETARDLGLRTLIVAMTGIALAAILRALDNFRRSAQLQVALERERAKAAHVEEMRLAAAGLAHEARNPLNVVRGLAQSLAGEEEPQKLSEQAGIIVDEVDRVNARLSEFIAYSRPRDPQPTEFDLDKLASQIADVLAADAEDKNVRLVVRGLPLRAFADRDLLRQVLFNLALNAVDAVPDYGQVWIDFGPDGTQKLWLEVSDDGPGVPPDAQNDIFKPYFTLNPGGTGLGLAVVRQIASTHGWQLSYRDNSPNGAVFRLAGIAAAS